MLCPVCGCPWHEHGELTVHAGGPKLVHPGQYVVQGASGELVAIDAYAFEALFQ